MDFPIHLYIPRIRRGNIKDVIKAKWSIVTKTWTINYNHSKAKELWWRYGHPSNAKMRSNEFPGYLYININEIEEATLLGDIFYDVNSNLFCAYQDDPNFERVFSKYGNPFRNRIELCSMKEFPRLAKN